MQQQPIKHPSIVRLTDAEMDSILSAARPLDVDQRDPFLRAVYAELARHGGTIGPGIVYRIAREQQKLLFRAPPSSETGGNRVGKYGREPARVDGGG